MARLTGLLLLGLGLVLGVFGLLADRALAERVRREQDAARAAAQETARLTALSVRAALAQVEQAVAAQKPAPGLQVDHLAEPPALTATSGAVAYSARSRLELARLLVSERVTANGLPEAVVARIALGDTPGEPGQRVGAGRGRAPALGPAPGASRGSALPRHAPGPRRRSARAGARAAAEAGARRRACRPLPGFLRTRAANDRVEGWARAGRLRLHYVVTLASLYDRAGVAPRLLPERAQGGVLAEVPDVPGLTLRVRADRSDRPRRPRAAVAAVDGDRGLGLGDRSSWAAPCAARPARPRARGPSSPASPTSSGPRSPRSACSARRSPRGAESRASTASWLRRRASGSRRWSSVCWR